MLQFLSEKYGHKYREFIDSYNRFRSLATGNFVSPKTSDFISYSILESLQVDVWHVFLDSELKIIDASREFLLEFYTDFSKFILCSEICIELTLDEQEYHFIAASLERSHKKNLMILGLEADGVDNCRNLLSLYSFQQVTLEALTGEAAWLLMSTVPWNTVNIHILKIIDCFVPNETWIGLMCSGLAQNHNFQRYFIENCGLTDRDTDHIVSMIRNSSTLVGINVLSSGIRNSISRIFDAVQNNKRIKRLKVDQITIGEAATINFIDIFNSFKHVQFFGFFTFDWTSVHMAHYAKILKQKSNFISLDLFGCTFTKQTMELFVDAIAQNPFIEELDLTATIVSDVSNITPYIAKLVTKSQLRTLAFFDVQPCDLSPVISALQNNYYITELNPIHFYNELDTFGTDATIQGILGRNKKHQRTLAGKLLSEVRALALVQFPYEILTIISDYLCIANLIPPYWKRRISVAVLDPASIGKIASGDFSQKSLIDNCDQFTV